MIGDELRKQRKFKELFRKDIAEKTGMHQQTIRNIENGTGLMSTVEKYAEAMGLEIGAPRVLRKLVEAGHNLILFTMRSNKKIVKCIGDPNWTPVAGNYLDDAMEWFKKHDIPLYAIQVHPDQRSWTDAPKCYGHLIIDDISLGMPLHFDQSVSQRPYIDWIEVEKMLIKRNLI